MQCIEASPDPPVTHAPRSAPLGDSSENGRGQDDSWPREIVLGYTRGGGCGRKVEYLLGTCMWIAAQPINCILSVRETQASWYRLRLPRSYGALNSWRTVWA